MKFNFWRESIVRIPFAIMIVLVAIFWVALKVRAVEGEPVVVSTVEWKERASELRIKGTGGGQKQTVTVL